MTIDISKINPGDKVTLVPLEVTDVVGSGHVRVMFDTGWARYFTAGQISAHHPAPREIGVGDRVKASDGTVGTVRAVDGREAWVRWDDYSANWSAEINHLTLVEGDQ